MTTVTSEGCAEPIKIGFYLIGKTIGKGNSSIVKYAKHSITKTEVAIKIIDKSRLDSDTTVEKMRREVEVLKSLRHPGIIKLYQVMESEKCIYLISEFVPNGEIFEHIAKHGKFSEEEAKLKFAQILVAVDYCHNLGVAHRDLKAENLLLDSNFNVKIADFGFCNNFSKDKKLSTWCGSPPYAAPEIFEGRSYCGPEVDIWSLGVVLYVLVCGMLPFDGENLKKVRDRVISGRFRIPFFMSTECERLLRRILVVDPQKRYTMQQIKQHVWVKEALEKVQEQQLGDSLREKLVITGKGINISCHDIVLQRMEEAKINKSRVLESLQNQAYDNFSAIYEMLIDKIAKHIKSYPGSRLGAAGLRRASAISEQVMVKDFKMILEKKKQDREKEESGINQGDSPSEVKPPWLGETREAVFSQTTDGVLLSEVSGPLCQIQQRIQISNDQSSVKVSAEGSKLMIIPTSPSRPKLVRSPRAIAQALCRMRCVRKGHSPKQLAEDSIDEGVETEADHETRIPALEVKKTPLPPPSSLPLQKPVDFEQRAPGAPPCKASMSVDSNIEVDMGSDLFLASTPLGFINPSDLLTPSLTSEDIMQPSPQPSHSGVSVQDQTDFRKGRRASEGVAPHQDSGLIQSIFLKHRAWGVAELRKELIKLQNEIYDRQQQHLINKSQITFLKQQPLGFQQQHLTTSWNPPQLQKSCSEIPVNNPSPTSLLPSQNFPNKIPISPNNIFPNTLTSNATTFQTPNPICPKLRNLPYVRQPTDLSGVSRTPSPLRGSFKRHLGPMRPLPNHHYLLHRCPSPSSSSNQGHSSAYSEHFSSASNSPVRGGKNSNFSSSFFSSLSSEPSSSPLQSFYNANSSCYPPSVCQSGTNISTNLLIGSPTRKSLQIHPSFLQRQQHIPNPFPFPQSQQHQLFSYSQPQPHLFSPLFKDKSKSSFEEFDFQTKSNNNNKQNKTEMEQQLKELQKSCEEPKEMLTSTPNSPN